MLVAAAAPINLRRVKTDNRSPSTPWQDDAWRAFDEVPEVKHHVLFMGNALAKLRLFVAAFPPDDPESDPIPASDPASGIPAAAAALADAELDRLRSRLGGRPEMLRRLEMNLEVAGEAYIVGLGAREAPPPDPRRPDEETEGEPEDWWVCSKSEVTRKEKRYFVKRDPDERGTGRALDEDLDTIFRVWLPHARWFERPDSNLRGVLPTAEALIVLNNQVIAESRSRASAGAFTVPNELSIGAPLPIDDAGGEGGEDEDPFMTELVKALVTPAEDPASVASLVPLLIRGPGDAMVPDKLRRIDFARTPDGSLETRIEAATRRLARGLNSPVEVVLGHQATTFANAEQVDQDTYEDYLEPRCVFVADALTVGFLRPQLAAGGIAPEIVDRLFVWFDPGALIASPDLTANADAAFDRFTISNDAYRRAKGFSADDAPEPEEVVERAGLRRGILTADLTVALIQALADAAGVDLPENPGGAGAGPPGEAVARLLARRSGPSIVAASRPRAAVDPGRRLAAIDRDLRSRLLTLANDTMTRALERAGNKLKSKANGGARDTLRRVPPLLAAATLGPTLVAAAGIGDDELLAEAFDAMEAQFMAWGAAAQRDALEVVGRVVGGFSLSERERLGLRQADDLATAWGWLKETLTALAAARLYDPNPSAAGALGEFDPTLRVPPGAIRAAVAQAGGAAGLSTGGAGDAWVTLVDAGTRPAGGIGTGELLRSVLRDEGAITEAYVWDYGPGFRARPFDPHVGLDGVTFDNFDDPVLANREGWPPFAFYMPGDHAGCQCDFLPIILPRS